LEKQKLCGLGGFWAHFLLKLTGAWLFVLKLIDGALEFGSDIA